MDRRTALRRVLEGLEDLDQDNARAVLWLALEAVDPASVTAGADFAAPNPFTEDELNVLRAVDGLGLAGARAIAGQLKLGHDRVKVVLRNLGQRKAVEKVGSGPNVKYRLPAGVLP